jgi:WD40 repeat protein
VIVLDVAEKAVITRLAFTADSKAVRLTAERRTSSSSVTIDTHLRDVATGKRNALPVGGFIHYESLCDHPSGRWVFGWKGGYELAAYHPTKRKTVVERVEAYPSHLALTPDGRTLLFDWCESFSHYQNGYASRTWSDAETFGPGFSVVVDTSGSRSAHRLTCCGLAPLSDNKRFVTVNWRMLGRPRLAVRSTATGKALAEIAIEARDQPTLAVSRDGNLAAVAVARSVFVFATTDLARPLRTVKNDNRKHFTGIAFHPSGKYLAATSNDATVKLYDTTTWDVARTFTWDIGKMRSIAFSPDGALAAAGSDSGKVVVWDVDL